MERVVPAVLAGGALGAVGRWAIGEIGWSAGTTLLVVNTIGCLVLGAVIAEWPDRDHPIRLALGVGVCGGLTTFSGLAIELALRLDDGDVVGVVLLTGASLVFGIAALAAGRLVRS